MQCSHYRLQTFLGMIIDELDKPNFNAEVLRTICIEFSLALSREAEEQRANATQSREFYFSR